MVPETRREGHACVSGSRVLRLTMESPQVHPAGHETEGDTPPRGTRPGTRKHSLETIAHMGGLETTTHMGGLETLSHVGGPASRSWVSRALCPQEQGNECRACQ